mgnify:CR=1 FL=1
MRRHNNKGYFSPITITALLLALLIAGLPFIASGPVKDDDILTPLPTPETTMQESSVIVTTKKRTDASPAPSATVKPGNDIPSGIVSGETVSDVQEKAKVLESVALSLYSENGDSLTADMVREKAAVPADEHFIVTISVKNGNVSKISYFTEDYSVSYANGSYSALANIADEDFEDLVLFL